MDFLYKLSTQPLSLPLLFHTYSSVIRASSLAEQDKASQFSACPDSSLLKVLYSHSPSLLLLLCFHLPLIPFYKLHPHSLTHFLSLLTSSALYLSCVWGFFSSSISLIPTLAHFSGNKVSFTFLMAAKGIRKKDYFCKHLLLFFFAVAFLARPVYLLTSVGLSYL